MRRVIRESILNALKRVLLSTQDSRELSKLSNYTIHNASIFQDTDSLSFAIIVYALSKLVSRGSISSRHITILGNMRDYLKNNKVNEYRKEVGKLYKAVSEQDRKLGLYTEEVIDKAKIRKGAAMFQHGISLARVAETLGITTWELMPYIGNTRTVDTERTGLDVLSRLSYAKELFGI